MSHWDCDHPTTELRAMRIVTGIQYKKQCLVCGRAASNPIKHSEVSVFPPEWDEAIAMRWDAAARARHQADQAARDGQIPTESLERRETYQRYLCSSEWRERRRLALLRDRNICQGCLTARAVEVHHLTYVHIGRELLYELVSLCMQCHETAHSAKVPLEGEDLP
jgi:5-methylcytosine-specific restriction endonuclease McrA